MLDADLLALGVLAARIVHEAHVILKVGGATYFFQNSTGVISPSRWNMPSESVHSQSKLFGGSPR